MFKIFLVALMINISITSPVSAQECMSMHVVLNTAAGYLDDAGEITGYHNDFLTALEEASGICMEKKLMPHSRAKRSIQIGAHDGGILGRSNNAEDGAEHIIKLLTSKTVIIPRKGLTLNNADDLSKIKIARIRKGNVNNALSDVLNTSCIDVTDYENGLQLLRRGRVDAVMGTALGLNIIINDLKMEQEVNLSGELIIEQREVWLVLSKKSKYIDKVEQLREAAQALIDKGVLENILKKYFGENWKLFG